MKARKLSFYIWLHYYIMLLPAAALIGLSWWLGVWWLVVLSVAFLLLVAGVKLKLMRDLQADVARLVDQANASLLGEHVEPLHTAFAEINELSATFGKAELDRQLIIKELHHRGRNTLAKVQMLIVAAIRKSPDLSAASQRVYDLVGALKRQDDLLVRHSMRGATLHEVFSEELDFHCRDHRIGFDGPDVLLDRPMAEAMGIVAHELATNAVKHGSLRIQEGSVSVCWHVDKGWCVLAWSEHGPPPLEAESSGFGSTLLESILQRNGATLNRVLGADGLMVTITFPHGAP